MTVQNEAREALTTLDQMREEVFAVNQANGWFDDERTFDDDIALLHSEVSEMFEAFRDGGLGDATVTQRAVRGVGVDFHDDSKITYEPIENPKPLGFGSECADVLIRLLDTAHRRRATVSTATDVAFAVGLLEDVEDYYPFDPQLTVGGHIAKMHALIAVIYPGSHLMPTLRYLVTLCRHLGIDLRSEYERKLAFNRTRGYKHGGKTV